MEAALLSALQTGDPTAQRRFWRERWDDVFRICVSILGNEPRASEVTQDVMTDFLFDAVHRLRNPAAARSYLWLMAARRSRRRIVELRRHSDGDIADLPEPGEANAETTAGHALLRPRLDDCLDRLTPKARRVMQLRYGAEMTNEQIGGLVGGSKQYIGRLIKESLAKLRACLEPPGSEVAR